ncbi:low molecular weight phosphotyrosine protein phosphatase [Donghicola sp. C2-DW-16]|uniref:protein-tyrosine-phosphatase n=1 Tax=Donghicola mangrovi TaxID=2729614 RepID=A0ABX2PFM8_9RHOB|nr:low molecular weight protein-tyrosine-phosphatase [Donghicola mangrovi]NVO28302.1 low molecular weight phosphotyrosine protein phosphatase [Donghicola mangrovi]
MTSILFVCLGNICRSPSAEGVVRAMAGDLDLSLDSAGTGPWHVGEAPYGPMQTAATARGYDLSDLRARQITKGDFGRFDLIITMDKGNQRDVLALRPKGNQTPVRMLSDYSKKPGTDVPDPYYSRDFDGTLDMIEDCARGLIAALRDHEQ